MVAVGRERQAQAQVALQAVAQPAEAGDVAGVVAAVVFRLVDRIAAVGAQAPVQAAAHGQAQLVGGDGAAQVEGGAVVVAKAVIALRGAIQRDLADPFLADLAGDDVDDAAHGVRPIERGHRAAHHLDALDRRHRRNEVGVDVAKAVGTRAGAVLVQPLAVDQHQRVVAGQTANADVHAAGLAAALDRHALDIGHRVGQVVKGLGFEFLARDDRDGRGRFLDLLLEARRRDHDGIELVGHAILRALGVDGARCGEGQRQGNLAQRKDGDGTGSPGAAGTDVRGHGSNQKNRSRRNGAQGAGLGFI